VSDTPFFAQNVGPGVMNFQYFSFITMTTVGYGDLTPATAWGQTLATMEAVIGQVFLVTVVALTVSNLGRTLPHRAEIEERLEADAEDAADDGAQADAR
jgi:voltage-gated potassium channel Kch